MKKIVSLPSGLRLAINTLPHTKSVAIGIYVGTGSANETKKNNGISHFIEHMLFKGTTTRTAFQIAEEMESIGAQINAYTSREVTSFYTIATNEHTAACLQMLSDLIFDASFTEENIKKEKGVVLEEIKMCEDDPSDICNDLLNQSYYGKSGLGLNILGNKATVESFTAPIMREYMSQYYTADNIVISIAGDIDYKTALNLVKKYFEEVFAASKNKFVGSATLKTAPKKSLAKVKPIGQCHLGFIFPSYEYDNPLSIVVTLISYVLGGGMSSRMFQKLREELGVVYDVYVAPSTYAASGMLEVYLATSPATAEQAVTAVAKVIKDYCKNGMTEKEFKKGKEQIKTSLVLGAEKSISIMRSMGYRALMTNKIYDIDAIIDAVNRITLNDIKEASEYIFDTTQMSAAYVGKKPTFDALEVFNAEFNKVEE